MPYDTTADGLTVTYRVVNPTTLAVVTASTAAVAGLAKQYLTAAVIPDGMRVEWNEAGVYQVSEDVPMALTTAQDAHLMAIPTTPLGTGGVTTSTPITRSVVVERGTDKVLSFDADTVGRVSTLRLYLPGDEGLPALSKSGTPAGTLTNVSLTDTETAALSGSYRMVLDSVLGDNTRRDLTGTLVAV